jgi:hypothetical protein
MTGFFFFAWAFHLGHWSRAFSNGWCEMLGETVGGGLRGCKGRQFDVPSRKGCRDRQMQHWLVLAGVVLWGWGSSAYFYVEGRQESSAPFWDAACRKVPGIGLGEQEFTCDDRILSGYKIWRGETMGLITILTSSGAFLW